LIKSTCSVKTTPSLFCTRLVDSFQCDWLFVYEECASDSAPFSFVYLFIVFFFLLASVFLLSMFSSLLYCGGVLHETDYFGPASRRNGYFYLKMTNSQVSFQSFYINLYRREIWFSFWYYLFINSVSNNNLFKTRKQN
jgi:hypothetical protein